MKFLVSLLCSSVAVALVFIVSDASAHSLPPALKNPTDDAVDQPMISLVQNATKEVLTIIASFSDDVKAIFEGKELAFASAEAIINKHRDEAVASADNFVLSITGANVSVLEFQLCMFNLKLTGAAYRAYVRVQEIVQEVEPKKEQEYNIAVDAFRERAAVAVDPVVLEVIRIFTAEVAWRLCLTAAAENEFYEKAISHQLKKSSTGNLFGGTILNFAAHKKLV